LQHGGRLSPTADASNDSFGTVTKNGWLMTTIFVKPEVADMNRSKFQVLLLGCDPKLSETVALVIRLDGGSIGIISNYAEALRYMQTTPPDVLLLDLKSAEADSLNLLRQIKHNPPGMPVISLALAPAGEDSSVGRAFDLGLNQFVQHPFDNGLFKAHIRSAVQVKRRLEESSKRQQQLAEACRAAEANSRAKSEFLAAMSHEIRTPMNGVIAMTAMMMETGLTPDQRGFLETIHNSSESLLTIINDILDFSKIESGKMELEKRSFDLRACIEESLDLLAPRMLEKKLEMGYEADDTLPALVVGDCQRLRQVLVNLLSNAVKFTEHGEVCVRVHKLMPASGEMEIPNTLRLHFAVRDSGIGIPADRLARLFRPFMQADVSTARKYGGTGLGLAISRRLVELMGGRMWAESVAGQGSTFNFTINVMTVAESKPPAHVGRQARLADLKILILDDNASCRNLLFEQCRRWGMSPQAVENSAQVMELLRQNNIFDLALVDLQLPGMDGFAVAAEMQKFPTAAMLPIVMLLPLGHKANGEMPQVMFAHSVTKPVKPAQLCAALEHALLSPRTPVHAPEASKVEVPLAEQMPLRILLVDDNAINQKVAVRILQQFGYQPEVAVNGVEALAALDRTPFDFIFMDVMMPEMDGLEATRLVRRRQMTGEHAHYKSRIIVVAMTAHAMQGDRDKCIAAGMDDYLSKPVRPKDIRDMLERWGGKVMTEIRPPEAKLVDKAGVEPAVDMDRMRDLTDGNLESLRELVEMYFNQTDKQFVQMKEAIGAGNADSVRRIAHSCAGASATLGMTHLVPKLRDLEKLGASGSLTGADEICQSAFHKYGCVREFLEAQPGLGSTAPNLNQA
jgi:signal transduction histidine kinase/two-component SAPR family response regulator/HPt (histidine-containing phosphotransfer) domain-containing protein